MGTNDLDFIGQSIRRKEDVRFLTGAGQYTDDESRDAHQPPGDRRKPELGRDCDQRSWRTADELGGREFRRQALAAQRVQRAAGGDTPRQLDQREQTLHEAGERVG